MSYSFEDHSSPELFAEIDIFLNNKSIEDIDISLKNDEFNSVTLKLPQDSALDVEVFLNEIEKKYENRFYIITTFVPYMDQPELKRYYVPYARLNEFLFSIFDPEYDEEIISIVQAEEDNDRYN